MRVIGYTILIILFIIAVTFACLNAQHVDINYYVGHYQLPLSLLLAIAIGAGGLLGLFFSLAWFFKLKSKIRKLRQRVKIAEKELENLRVIPVKDNH